MTTRAMLFLLLLAATALALPSRLQKRSFKTPVRGRTQRGPFDDIRRVHQKYGSIIDTTTTATATSTSANVIFSTLSTVSATQSTAATTPVTYSSATATKGSEDGEVTATPEANEIEYLSPVVIGGQPLNLNFDTGSADLWVFSTSIPESIRGNHSVYDPGSSRTYTELNGSTWYITYGDGSTASGTAGFDTVDVGGSTVEKQCIELATTVAKSFLADPASDGLLGLGFGSINRVKPTPQKTFFENVMNDLSEPLFTANLMDDSGAGTYEFGVIDNSKYTGDIHYVDVDNSDGFWQFSLPSVRIGADQTLTCSSGECTPIIADTGTSLLYLDRAVVKAYYSNVAESRTLSGNYIYPCNTTLPDFALEIGGHYFPIKGEDMTYLAFTEDDGSGEFGNCLGGLQPTPTFQVQILGDIFLKQMFAVFDGGNMRFGVAEQT